MQTRVHITIYGKYLYVFRVYNKIHIFTFV